MVAAKWAYMLSALARVAMRLCTLADNLFEEVEPAVILKDRKNENGTRDFLVKWADGEEDTWVGHCTLMESSGAKLGCCQCITWEDRCLGSCCVPAVSISPHHYQEWC